ncbi:hypothetical protein [Halalkalibacter oceani]|uniref:hypothetical protein n=1 Tax=Halalkalibacter oceani TaxID=1653776 RepID=UPI00339B77A2
MTTSKLHKISKGQKVGWFNEEEAVGVIEAVTDEGFIVNWKDTGLIDYSHKQAEYLVEL